MRPQDLPEALRRLQGQNMDQLGAMQDLIGGVRKRVSPARSGGQAAVAAGIGLLLVNGTVAPAAEIRLSADGREALGYAGAAAALLNIPAGVGAIAAGAFSGCPLTETVVLPEGITAIGAGAFSACPRLSGVIFPDSLQSIGENAFAGCGALQRVSLEEGLRDIGAGAFKNCAALQDIYWGDNIRRLGAGAFAGCGLGPRLELPPGLENIGENAFADCAALEEVVVPASLGCVGSGAFGGCQALRRVILDKGAASSVIPAFSRWGGEALAAIRPQIEISDNITAIGAGAFAACTYLRHIVIPGQVKRIEENAFAGCSALRRVDMSGPKLESICRRAFAGCAALQKLQLPAGLKFIGAEAFAGCEALTSLTFPEGLEIVEEGAFRDCAGLTAIAAPGAMPPNYRASGLNEGPPRLALHMRRHVADGAGAGFQAIKTLSFDKDIVHIGAGAFENCGGLTHLRLPRELQSIGDGAFAGCGALSGGLKFAPAIRIIGAGAFAGCAALEYLTLAPAYNCSIGKDAFGGCRGLKSVKFDSGASISIGEGAFRGCSGLRELRAPQAGDLKAGAFADCHGLTRLVITGEHTGLGEGAFRSCLRLAEVEFSANPEYYLPMDFTRIFAGAPYLARVDSGVCLKCGARSRRRFCQKCLRPLARAGRRLLSGANPMLLALLLLLAGLLLPYLIKLLTEALNRACGTNQAADSGGGGRYFRRLQRRCLSPALRGRRRFLGSLFVHGPDFCSGAGGELAHGGARAGPICFLPAAAAVCALGRRRSARGGGHDIHGRRFPARLGERAWRRGFAGFHSDGLDNRRMGALANRAPRSRRPRNHPLHAFPAK
jgi:hypothetical protein